MNLSLMGLAALAASANAAVISMTNAIGGAVVGTNFVVGVAATAAGVNNWPAGEPPAAAIDGNTATKYLNFAELNTGIIVTPASGSGPLRAITFTTANDSPNRDPLTFTIYGSAVALAGAGPFNLSSMATLASGITGLATDPGRFTAGAAQNVPNDTAFASYVVIFPTVRDTATANSMQVSEIAFDTTAIPEPSALGLGGLALLGLLRRRRN
jgi:uncharacterized protein (TIGR03382 family)